MELNNINLFDNIKGKKFDEALLELDSIYEKIKDGIFELIFLPLIKMNYLNFVYDLITKKSDCQKLFEFINKLSTTNDKNQFYLVFITHLEYILLKISNEQNEIQYCINLIQSITKYKKNDGLLLKKLDSTVLPSIGTESLQMNVHPKIFNSLFNNSNLPFETKYKIFEELTISFDSYDSKLIYYLNNRDLFYFFDFYKNCVLNKKLLHINNDNDNNAQEDNKYYNIMKEYFQIAYLYDFIFKITKKYKNQSALKDFKKYLDIFINNHPYLTKKYKYNYSNETFEIIKDYIFLNVRNGYYSEINEKIDEKLFFEFILNNEKLSNFNLKNPKEAFFLDKILLSGKYDYSDYIINNWNTLFPLNILKEKKYNEEKHEIDGDEDDTDSDEENHSVDYDDDHFLINLDYFIKSLLSLDFSEKSNNQLNFEKLFAFLESKMHVIIKYYSYSIIPNYYDMHKNLMKKNQHPAYYRFCLNYILEKNITINYKNINNPTIGKSNFMAKAFEPEMNIFIKRTINNLVYDWKAEFNYNELLDEMKKRVCIYCLLIINVYDSVENRLKDVNNFFNNFLYVLDDNIEAKMNPYKEIMIYYCNKLKNRNKNKEYNSIKICCSKKNQKQKNKESIIEQKKFYWLNLYKIMILIYIRKKFNEKYNPSLLWECLSNYYDIKGIFNLLVNYCKEENNDIDKIFKQDLIMRFCIFTNEGIYFKIIDKINDKEYIKLLVDKREEIGFPDKGTLFMKIIEKQLKNKNLFSYLWDSFDVNYKRNLLKNNIKVFIKSYLDYTFKRFHFFQNNMLEGLKLVFSNEELKSLKLLEPLKEEFPIEFNYDNIKIIE